MISFVAHKKERYSNLHPSFSAPFLFKDKPKTILLSIIGGFSRPFGMKERVKSFMKKTLFFNGTIYFFWELLPGAIYLYIFFLFTFVFSRFVLVISYEKRKQRVFWDIFTIMEDKWCLGWFCRCIVSLYKRGVLIGLIYILFFPTRTFSVNLFGPGGDSVSLYSISSSFFHFYF